MSAYVIPNHATHAALVTIDYESGEPTVYPVAFGSMESCDEAARTMGAVSNSDERRATGARVSVVPLHRFCDACRQRHDGACEALLAADADGVER